eukprot:scaffold135451_cov32-Tisochrysis_lutea.AAC.2
MGRCRAMYRVRALRFRCRRGSPGSSGYCFGMAQRQRRFNCLSRQPASIVVAMEAMPFTRVHTTPPRSIHPARPKQRRFSPLTAPTPHSRLDLTIARSGLTFLCRDDHSHGAHTDNPEAGPSPTPLHVHNNVLAFKREASGAYAARCLLYEIAHQVVVRSDAPAAPVVSAREVVRVNAAGNDSEQLPGCQRKIDDRLGCTIWMHAHDGRATCQCPPELPPVGYGIVRVIAAWRRADSRARRVRLGRCHCFLGGQVIAGRGDRGVILPLLCHEVAVCPLHLSLKASRGPPHLFRLREEARNAPARLL